VRKAVAGAAGARAVRGIQNAAGDEIVWARRRRYIVGSHGRDESTALYGFVGATGRDESTALYGFVGAHGRLPSRSGGAPLHMILNNRRTGGKPWHTIHRSIIDDRSE
jgi:hypothetical protein